MKSARLKIILVLAGAVLFNIIFWQENMGINSALFDAFILISVFYLYPSAFSKPVMKWLVAAHLISLTAVIIHNTFISKLAFSTTLLLVVVFTQYLHRSIWYAAGSALMNYVLMIGSFFANIQLLKSKTINFYGLKKRVRFCIIPLVLLLIFFAIYSFANTIFQNLVNDIATAIEHFFTTFFTWFSWERLVFLLFGSFITGGLLLKSKVNYFSDTDNNLQNNLLRKKNDLVKWQKSSWFQLLYLVMGKSSNGSLALRNENRTAVISLALLNALLLCINAVDVVYVWFGFNYKNNINLSEYVHDGISLLIFSIFLAMVLLLFFFRGNLNFYAKNKGLRFGAYAWLMQNLVLVVSVLFRDYYYIVHYGLAYKRIGVLIFLLLVLAGLVTVFIKIHQRKTDYFLWRVNAWVAIIILVISSCINWDESIAKYNLTRKNSIALDVQFLLTLSDKVLPLLQKNKDVLDRKTSLIADVEFVDDSTVHITPMQIFENRKTAFFLAHKNYSWLSWNMADATIKNELLTEKQTAVVTH